MKQLISIIACLGLLVCSVFAYAAYTTNAAPAPVTVAETAKTTTSSVTVGEKTDDVETSVLAKVVRVKPVYATKMVPHHSCHWEPRTYVYPNQRAVPGSGTLMGGAAGGLIGSRFGGGNGNIAATIGGAVVGAMIGNNIEGDMNRPYVANTYVKVCGTHLVKESYIKGYDVTYVLNGKPKTTFMKDKPISDQILLELSPVAE